MQTLAADHLSAALDAANLDPLAGVQIAALVDVATVDPSRPALLLITDAQPAPDAFRHYPSDTAVTVITQGGRRQLSQYTAPLATVMGERWVIPPKAVAIALPTVAPESVQHDIRSVLAVIARLRDPQNGCPWDLAQDHRSLRPHLLQETYETLSALDRDDPAALREELGDLLLQIILHAQIASQNGSFDIGGVSEGIRTKLIRRHPHVFGDVDASTPEEVSVNWDQIKASERADDASALDGVPQASPALARAQNLAGRAARQGFAWPDDAAALAKLAEELREIAKAAPGRQAEEFGDLLFVMADFARRHDWNAEEALREASSKFETRFRALEASLRKSGQEMHQLDHPTLLREWKAVKQSIDQLRTGASLTGGSEHTDS